MIKRPRKCVFETTYNKMVIPDCLENLNSVDMNYENLYRVDMNYENHCIVDMNYENLYRVDMDYENLYSVYMKTYDVDMNYENRCSVKDKLQLKFAALRSHRTFNGTCLNPLMAVGNNSYQFLICCPRDCVSRHNGGTSVPPLNPSESIVF